MADPIEVQPVRIERNTNFRHLGDSEDDLGID